MIPETNENLVDFIRRFEQQTDVCIWRGIVSYRNLPGAIEEEELPHYITHPSPPYIQTSFGEWFVLVLDENVFNTLYAREGSSLAVCHSHRGFSDQPTRRLLELEVKSWCPQCRGKYPLMVAWFSRTMVFVVEPNKATSNNLGGTMLTYDKAKTTLHAIGKMERHTGSLHMLKEILTTAPTYDRAIQAKVGTRTVLVDDEVFWRELALLVDRRLDELEKEKNDALSGLIEKAVRDETA